MPRGLELIFTGVQFVKFSYGRGPNLMCVLEHIAASFYITVLSPPPYHSPPLHQRPPSHYIPPFKAIQRCPPFSFTSQPPFITQPPLHSPTRAEAHSANIGHPHSGWRQEVPHIRTQGRSCPTYYINKWMITGSCPLSRYPALTFLACYEDDSGSRADKRHGRGPDRTIARSGPPYSEP